MFDISIMRALPAVIELSSAGQAEVMFMLGARKMCPSTLRSRFSLAQECKRRIICDVDMEAAPGSLAQEYQEKFTESRFGTRRARLDPG